MSMSHQIDHGVHLCTCVAQQEIRGSIGRFGGERVDARGVDDRQSTKEGRRPIHLHTADLVRSQAAQSHDELSVVAAEWQLGNGAILGYDAGRRRGTVLEPRRHLGALPGVGRREVIGQEGIDQRGFARLHLSRDSHPQGPLQATPGRFDLSDQFRLAFRCAGCDVQRVPGERHRIRGVEIPHHYETSCSCGKPSAIAVPRPSNSASAKTFRSSFILASRSIFEACAAVRAASSDSLRERCNSSARCV